MKITFLYIVLLIPATMAFSQNGEEKVLTHHEADDRYGSYSPDGAHIIFESNRDGNWEIYSMDADGKNQQRLTNNEADDRRPSWHPNGKKIIFESDRSGTNQLYVLSLRNRKIKPVNIEGLDGEPIFARFSPDGKEIAFSCKKSDDTSNIMIISKNGKKVKSLTSNPFRSHYPNWSPDGKMLLFFSRHETDNEDDEIYKINRDGSGEKRLTHWPKHNFCPSWSNDGKRIAYVTSMQDNRPEIFIMDANGENASRVTYNNDGDTLPNWSMDNKKLLITAYRNGNYEICELSIDPDPAHK
ncbi:MAG: hypothetical protein AAF489_13230 [Bacteroidota bacterium]